MRVDFFLAWYDLWVGAYWSTKNRTLYVCPLPCVVFSFEFPKRPCQRCNGTFFVEGMYPCPDCNDD
jgi:hypothetical protein